MPFLTLLDPRAKIKGSRDPLGLQSIWTRFGRQVVSNLTTVTTSVRGFTVLLLGLYFAEQAVEQNKASEADFPALFLKFEQLAAYSRVARRNGTDQEDDGGILGIQRVKKNLRDGNNRVRISAHQDHQILSNQKTYGLWGLYTVAARNSGLLETGHPRITPAAREFIEIEYIPRLDHAGQTIFHFLNRDRVFEPRHKDSALASNLAKILRPKLTGTETAFYSKHLLFGGKSDTLQRRLWEQIRAVDSPAPFLMPELKAVIKLSQSAGDTLLTQRLEYIRQVETVIALAGLSFGYILSQDGQTAADVVNDVKKEWGTGLRHLDPSAFSQALSTIEDVNPESLLRLINLAEVLEEGDYGQAIDLLLAQNKAVMQERGSDAWVKFKNRQFDVRFREESGALPAKEDLPNLWVNSYFINSLKFIGRQLN